MKVQELRRVLNQFPKDAEVFIVTNWDDVEDGQVMGISPIVDVSSQVNYYDDGLDFSEVTEVLISFD